MRVSFRVRDLTRRVVASSIIECSFSAFQFRVVFASHVPSFHCPIFDQFNFMSSLKDLLFALTEQILLQMSLMPDPPFVSSTPSSLVTTIRTRHGRNVKEPSERSAKCRKRRYKYQGIKQDSKLGSEYRLKSAAAFMDEYSPADQIARQTKKNITDLNLVEAEGLRIPSV